MQEEMQQYENIKSIKLRCDRHGYEINEAMVWYTTQREAEEAIDEINKGTEWHVEIYQNRYTEINEGRNKKTSKRSKTNKERQDYQSRKGIDKWQEEMDVLKSDVSQIKNTLKR